MSPAKKSIIDLFEDNELKISVLYNLYSQKINGRKRFWSDLSDQEVAHAKSISSSFFRKDKDCFMETKFSRGVIKYVNDFVDENIKRAKKEKLTQLEAVNTALRIEQSILEKKCFDLFIPKDETIQNVLERLNKDTQKHVNILRTELKRLNKK